MTESLGGPVRWTREEPKVVWVRLPSRRRRITGLRIGRGAGLVRVFADGRAWTVPASMASRPRRNGAARILAARLLGELRAYEANLEGLGPHHKGRDRR